MKGANVLHTGLVSITFRQLSPREIVDLVAQGGLEGIEWGGDVHVPHGDLQRAREVREMTVAAGLTVAAYGSYYRVGSEEDVTFSTVLESAQELGAPVVRVWVGSKGSADADGEYRDLIVQESRRIAEDAAKAGIAVACEFHNNTLTDTTESAQRFYSDVAHDNMKAYWQPNGATVEDNIAGLEAMLPWLCNIHAFAWERHEDGVKRQLMARAADTWGRYLEVAASTDREHFVMVEYVKDDAPEAFLEDAATLKSWIEG